MLKALITSALVLATTGAYAYTRTDALQEPGCLPAEAVMQELSMSFHEGPVQYDKETKKIVSANPANGSWTLVQFKDPQTLCVLAFGKEWKEGDDVLGEVEESL